MSNAQRPASSGNAYIYLPPHAFDTATDIDAVARRLSVQQRDRGIAVLPVVDRRTKIADLPRGLLITDSFARLAKSIPDLLRWIAQAREKGIIIVTEGLDFRGKINPDAVFEALTAFQRERRSISIKEALMLRRARGNRLGRNPHSAETIDTVLTTFATLKSIRRTAKATGISKSAVQRIVVSASKGGRDGQ